MEGCVWKANWPRSLAALARFWAAVELATAIVAQPAAVGLVAVGLASVELVAAAAAAVVAPAAVVTAVGAAAASAAAVGAAAAPCVD